MMKNTTIFSKNTKQLLLTSSGVLILFFIAWTLFQTKMFHPLVFPNPINIGKELILLFLEIETYNNIYFTTIRIIISTILATIIGVPLGIIIGYKKTIYEATKSIIDFFRSIPVAALVPIFMLFFGLGGFSKIMAGFWVGVLIIIAEVSHGVKHRKQSYEKLAQVFETSKKYVYKELLFMQSLPQIVSGVRVATSISLMVIIVFEMFVGSYNGIGSAIIDAQMRFQTAKLYALIMLSGIIGFTINKGLLYLERKTIHWTEK